MVIVKHFNPSIFELCVSNPKHGENSLCFILGAHKSFETGYIHPHKHYLSFPRGRVVCLC